MVLSFLPFLLFLASVSQIGYLSLISLLPGWQLGTFEVIGLHLGSFILTWLALRRYASYFVAKPRPADWLVLLPYLVIMLIRFPLIYPTYDDLAAHMVWGDYANTLWQGSTFMPMNFLHYFYLPLDMNYTPFLFLLGVRVTIWLFYLLTSLWFFSLYVRFAHEAKTKLQHLLITIVFIVLPFIPHLLGVIGTLMGDYASLAFCIEALYLFLRKDKEKTFAALVMLTAILMKQSNSVFIAPILLYYAFIYRKNIRWLPVLIYGALASIFFIRLYLETGNPLSGLFNGVFLSSLYSLSNFKQTSFGPESLAQLFTWPIIGQFSERYAEGIVSEMAKVFFAPIPILGYCLSLWLMIKKRSVKYGLLLLTYLLWSHLVGYARYYVALNLMALLILIFDIKSEPVILKPLYRYKYLLLGIIFLSSLSSFKTDFSWRPHPSLRVAATNVYYLKEYRDGMALVGRDTLPRMAREYQSFFAGYDAIITMYRGPVTFISYMGYLNGLPTYDGVTSLQYESIMADPKISQRIKSNLAASMGYSRVIVLAEKPYDQYVSTLKIYQEFQCKELGFASRDRYFQRESYFTQTLAYECVKPLLPK